MHRCLAIPEVIRPICAQFGTSRCGRAALSRLAVTYRAFLDPALDPLWKEQIRPVSQLLKIGNGCFSTHGASDLWRSHISTLAHGMAPQWRLWNLSPCPCPPTSSSRTWKAYHDIPATHWPRIFAYLLGPKVNKIDLELHGPARRLGLLPLISVRCPALMDVEIRYNGSLFASREHRARAASAMIRSLADIHTISVGGIDAAGCRHLAMPSLTSLTIDMFDEPLFDTRLPLPNPIFASLHTLSIHGLEVNFCMNFIAAGISDAPLDTLDVSMEVPALDYRSRSLITAITAQCSPELLTSVEVNLGECTDAVSANPDIYTVLPATLTPLLGLTNLVKTSSATERHSAGDRRFPEHSKHAENPSRPRFFTKRRAPFAVAAFLFAMFPALSLIRTSREWYFLDDSDLDPAPHNAETHKRWKEVEKLVPLVAVRDEDEIHWRQQLG
ncbi:hypothetical protein B0H17DRAFT_1137735 [Mycena rosella]|uniref:Uncharacterized protein n=1 Tax=Mycena rosella TaxID=1033263 RepID=A0AAD7DB77_MYCRO|nr:hypothetical protein B0H17DRAFT_1137735 [Mycena rosella]